MQDEAHTPVSGLFAFIIVERRRFCVSKKVRPLKTMPASKQAYKKRAEWLSFCMVNRKRYEVTCDIVPSHGRSCFGGVSIPQAV